MNWLKYRATEANIFLAQDVHKMGRKALSPFRKTSVRPLRFVGNINHFSPEIPKHKTALVTLPPWAWYEAVAQAPEIRNFNFTGLLYEIVRALNQNGYLVDILDLNVADFQLPKDYDLLIGHGGGCKTIIHQLKPNAKILQYVSGAYFQAFNAESEERYRRFKERNQVEETIAFTRSLNDLIDGERILADAAHHLFSCNAPRMVETFGPNKHKFFFTGLAAYLNDEFRIDLATKNYAEGRKNFIYVGGTHGNIQKGADVIVEAFAEIPDAHLFIYCELEADMRRHYRKELSLPNIHYIYHYRHQKKKLKKLLARINYTVHAPINTGVGTAFVGSMGSGLIPVGFIDLPANDYFILSSSFQPESLGESIRDAMKKTPEWCRLAAENAVAEYGKHWTATNFFERFNQLIIQSTVQYEQ